MKPITKEGGEITCSIKQPIGDDPVQEEGWQEEFIKDFGWIEEERRNWLIIKEIEFIKDLLKADRTHLIQEVEKKIPPLSSGECPSCNRPTISGFHPIDSDEHIAFYKAGLASALEILKK